MAGLHEPSDKSLVIQATEANVPSLATILPRAFFPVNPFIKKTFPDTPIMRAWWQGIFIDEIRDPACHVLTSLDPSNGTAMGVLLLRLMSPSDSNGGFWSTHPVTEDHDRVPYEAMIAGMVENENILMLGQTHFNICLLGTDYEYKGQGVGSRLLKRACQIADEAGHAMFVQANASAIGFYGKLGFASKMRLPVPGNEEYVEHLMVRPCVS